MMIHTASNPAFNPNPRRGVACESLPADPTLPSFLTWAPEVRNKVYDILFDHSDPIKIHSYRDQGKSMNYVPRSVAVTGIGLLATCRQVHVEATRVLYLRSTFFFIAGGDPHHLAVHIGTVEAWLTCIGRQRMLVQTVLIEFDCRRTLEITPIMREMRRHPTTNPDISFVPLGNALLQSNRSRPKEGPLMYWDYDYEDPTPLNKVLACLKAKAYPPMGTLARLRNMISDFHCQRDGSQIDFVFKKTLKWLSFRWSRDGTFKPYSQDAGRRPSLSMLFESNVPRSLLRRLLAPKYQEVVFDLDKNKMTPSVPVLMSVSREFREMALYDFCSAWYLVKLRSQSLTSNSASFPKLKIWAEQGLDTQLLLVDPLSF